MQVNEIWTEYRVNANCYQRFMLDVKEEQKGFKINIDAKISETDKNIIFHFAPYSDSQTLIKWMNQKWTYQKDSNNQVVKNKQGYPVHVAIPRPQITEMINVKTNILEKTVQLSPGSYTLMFDNTYSAINAKHVWLHIVETWDDEVLSQNLSIIEHMIEDLPDDVSTCINDANNCFTSGHYNQCSVMLRKAIEVAIKIKIQQSGRDAEEILDKSGNEISLSGKIKVLRKHKLITPRTASDLDQIKWFGDVGAHGTMRVALNDIKDNLEPKIRGFLVGLNLKI